MVQIIQLLNGSTILLIAGTTYLIVWGIKQSKINNQYLPLIAELIGAVSGIFIGFVRGDLGWIVGLVDGIAAGAVSVGGNELVKAIVSSISGGNK